MKNQFRTLLIIIFSGIFLPKAEAQFLYNMPIAITNNVNSTVLRWQVPIYINTAALVTLGQMQTDGRDIRFSKDCAGTQMLNYFIDSGMNTTKTKIWVKTDTLYPNASRTIYMLYGNNTVSKASTYATFNGPYSATDHVVPPNTNTVSDCQRGMKFSTTRNIIVSGFGKFTPDATTRWVTLFDFATQAKLEQIQVAGPTSTYSYQALANHMWLKPSTDYILTLHNATNDMYYYGATATTTPYIVYGDMRYCNSCNQNTFPTTVLTNNMYGIPDFEYYTVDTNNISTAPSYTLATGGGGGNADITLGDMPYICPGSTTALVPYTATSGSPLTYTIQWGATALSAGFTNVTAAPFPGSSPITVAVPASAAFGAYMGMITVNNVCGPGKSYPIIINVGGTINIDSKDQPVDTSVCPLDPSGFSITATGPTLSFQWQVQSGSSGWTDLVNAGDYANVTTPKLNILASQASYNGNKYRCMVTSTCTPAVSSNPGILNVSVSPLVSTEPADVLANPGQNVSFEVVVQGNAKFRWQVSEPGQPYVNMNDGPIYQGVKTSKVYVYGVSLIQNNFTFRCLLFNTNECLAPGDTSNEAILNVVPVESVKGLVHQEDMRIYPNPTGGSELYINTGNIAEQGLGYKMYDKLGRIVSSGRLANSGATKADIAPLAAGVYFIEVLNKDDQKIARQKFTKL